MSYYQKNKQKILAKQKAYDDAHRKEISIKNKNWLIKNSDYRKDYYKKWYAENKEWWNKKRRSKS